MAIRWPDVVPAGSVSRAFQSVVDIVPTLMAIFGIDPDPMMQGQNQEASWKNADNHVRDGVLIDHRVEDGLAVRSWVNSQGRLSHHAILGEARDELEYFDFTSDPNELFNLAASGNPPPAALESFARMERYRAEIERPWAERRYFA